MVKRRSKLSSYRQNKLLELFVGGVTARTAAELAGINRHSATLYYQKIRAMIAREIEDQAPFDGEIEVDESGKTLMPIITCKIRPDSVIYSDCWSAYNAIDVTRFRHHRINHSELFAEGKNHINGIESFWNQAKRMLRRYNGIPAKQFNFFLQECVFRFNYGSVDEQLAALKKWKKRHLA